MLPIELCEKILNSKQDRYSRNQILEIRDLLYQLANIEYQEYKNKKNGNECGTVYTRFDR